MIQKDPRRSQAALLAVLATITTSATGCTQITAIDKVCGSTPHNAICLGEMNIPVKAALDFKQAATLAIDIVHSEEFRDDLATFMRSHATSADIAAAWRGHDADGIVASLQTKIGGIQVSTFGCIKGLWYHVFSGTVAFERASPDEPILMNRWGLSSRTSAQIANTIIHETAHAAGLSHPHMGGPAPKNAAISACEPPYLLGSLAERIAAGNEWEWDPDHCSHLKQSRSAQ